MNKFITKLLILFFILTNNTIAEENIMILKLKDGDVKIELFEDVAPNHVKRIKQLAEEGKYDGVVFHRVIDGFMAQTGDVKFGSSTSDEFDLRRAGMGGSDLPDLKDSPFAEPGLPVEENQKHDPFQPNSKPGLPPNDHFVDSVENPVNNRDFDTNKLPGKSVIIPKSDPL